MAATPSVKIRVSFTRDGSTRVWSNRYHFNGGLPADSTHWTTFTDAIVAALKIPLPPSCEIIEAIGYNAGSDLPVFAKAYSTVGIYSIDAGNFEGPGDCAYLLKWSTTARTSKNHPVYLFSYMHGIVLDHTQPAGALASGQRSRYNDYGTAWVTGFSDGTHTLVRAGPNGATGSWVGRGDPAYVTHRDFP